MSYIGAQLQLLMYKNQKADVELKMILRQDDINGAVKDTQYVQKYYDQQLTAYLSANGGDSTDQGYLEYKNDLELQLQCDMADIQDWEEELQFEQDSDNAELAILNSNISNLQSLVQANVANSHTYGGGGQ